MSTSQDKPDPPPAEENPGFNENKENVPFAVEEPQQDEATIEETPVADNQNMSNPSELDSTEPNPTEPNPTVAAQKGNNANLSI